MDSVYYNPVLAKREPSFTRSFVRENGLDRDGFGGWAFHPGMLYGSREKWWGDGGRRNSPHEGLDFLFYRNLQGTIVRLEPEARVPVMYDGTVACIVKDFLGESVFVVHTFSGCDRPLLSIYGHTLPFKDLQAGSLLQEGEILGTLAGTSGSKAGVLPHLHISLGWAANLEISADLDWNKVNDPALVAVIDPLPFIGSQYSLI